MNSTTRGSNYKIKHTKVSEAFRPDDAKLTCILVGLLICFNFLFKSVSDGLCLNTSASSSSLFDSFIFRLTDLSSQFLLILLRQLKLKNF